MCRNEKSSNNLKILGSVLVWGFILILVTATAVAGVSSGAETKSTAPKIIEKFEVEEDFGVRKALAMLGSQCQKNIVPSPGVNGSLAFRRLTNVTFEEAMNAILGDNAVYEEQGNLIKVYTKEEYQKIMEDPGRMICKVFTLYYMSASEAVKLITPLKSAVGNIQASSPPEMVASTGESITTGTLGGDTMALNDTIVVNDYPENIAAISEMLKKLDVRPKQVLVEATILSATLQEGMKLGLSYNDTFAQK